jgi:hypothetical protein
VEGSQIRGKKKFEETSAKIRDCPLLSWQQESGEITYRNIFIKFLFFFSVLF